MTGNQNMIFPNVTGAMKILSTTCNDERRQSVTLPPPRYNQGPVPLMPIVGKVDTCSKPRGIA